MKTLFLSALVSGLLLSFTACTSQRQLTVEPDDRYYNSSDLRKERKQLKKIEQDADYQQIARTNGGNLNNDLPSESNPNAEEAGRRFGSQNNDFNSGGGNGTTIINNYNTNNFEVDDYYDYMFASRIRRFHRNPHRWGYYDPFFTNMFWYNPNPFFFGNSIYNTYNFWNPYSPWGWGAPGLNFGWNSWTGWNVGWGWNPGWGWNNNFYNPWAWNQNPFFSPWHYNPWMMNGMCSPMWAPGFWNPAFGNPMFMATNMNNSLNLNTLDQNTFFGARNSGVGGNSQLGRTEVALSEKMANNLGSSSASAIAIAGREANPNQSSKPVVSRNYSSQVATTENSRSAVTTPSSVKFNNAPSSPTRAASQPAIIPSAVDNRSSAASSTSSQIYRPEPVRLTPATATGSRSSVTNPAESRSNSYIYSNSGAVRSGGSSTRSSNSGTSTRSYNYSSPSRNDYSTPTNRSNFYSPPSNSGSRSVSPSTNPPSRSSQPSFSSPPSRSSSPSFSSPGSGGRSSGGSFNSGGSFGGSRSGGGSGGGGGSRSSSGGGGQRR